MQAVAVGYRGRRWSAIRLKRREEEGVSSSSATTTPLAGEKSKNPTGNQTARQLSV